MWRTTKQQREKNFSRALFWGNLFLVASIIIWSFYTWITTPPAQVDPTPAPPGQPDRTSVTVTLKRGDFTIYRYVPGLPEFAQHPKAILIFGSGDGGFDGWEDRVCKSLQIAGYEILGLDCNVYAKTDYDLDTLQADFQTIAQISLNNYKSNPPPLILAGWSMGAEQAIPAAGGPHPPTGLVGVLAISPGSRGRYGIRDADRWNVPPSGNGTYAIKDFAHSLNGLRVAQWDANLDLLGSKDWLSSLTATHKLYSLPYGLHDYNGADDDFLKGLKESLDWILSPDADKAKP